MSLALETYVIATNTVTLLCGGTVTLLAWRAYRRTASPALRALAAGLGLVTIGALLAGGLHQFLGVRFETSVGVQSTFTALGFVTLAYSLYARWDPPGRTETKYKTSD
jgi:phage tail protein X